MDEYKQAKLYLHKNYQTIMSTYSMIYTQLETVYPNVQTIKLCAQAAYYTVVAHLELKDMPLIAVIEGYIKDNKEKTFETFEQELALHILMESKIHDLESLGLVDVEKDESGNTSLTLTDLGKDTNKSVMDLYGEQYESKDGETNS